MQGLAVPRGVEVAISLPGATTDPFANLRVEEETFQGVESGTLPNTLRLWVNSECLVRGRHKARGQGWYDEDLASRWGVPVVERSSGGGVVYMDSGNLNWSFTLPNDGTIHSPERLFRTFSAPIVKVLEGVGLDASFGHPNRIDVNGRKVSGLAARTSPKAVLVHGTLLVSTNLARLNSLCIPPLGCPPVANLKEFSPSASVIGIARLLADEIRAG